jgi:dTDP-4-dehydrorhamnose reductase
MDMTADWACNRSIGPGDRALELWGGAECTVNRNGDRFLDQSHLTGHHVRADDAERLAGLGVAAVRFPLLWERVSPAHPDLRDWHWSDHRLGRFRDLGVRPIAGLIHHGSGPAWTSLLDDGFAPGLAAHAAAAARRYPWIEDWTPVNEPLTTARFSTLYGHWYPHARDERSFWLALLNQIDATRLAMRAIREIVPAARLIQTDDLGRTWSTAALADQAAFDNTRRWMTWDLLCGRVDAGHPFWQRLCDQGLQARLEAILADRCPPDVIGVNHYLTSDRFIDHRVERYPAHCSGGNGAVPYADIEAVRVLDPHPGGLAAAVTEAWYRYRISVAVTEVHNGCTREEQLRWLAEAWNDCLRLRAGGVDLRAMTAWSLFGSQGWNTLLTGEGIYEPGAWDCRANPPRETATAGLLRSLQPEHSATLGLALAGPGWWRRPERLLHAAIRHPAPAAAHRTHAVGARPPVVILGATGTLGRALARACRQRHLEHRLLARDACDLTSPASIAEMLDQLSPWAVINAAGWVRVDDAEANPRACATANTTGAVALAEACERRAIPCVSFSSDLVFGGEQAEWFTETDRPSPLNVYGHSKAAMEQGVLALGARHLVIRTAAFFSPHDVHNFAVAAMTRLHRAETFQASEHVVSPTYVPDLCDSTLDLLIDGEHGIWHLANTGAVSWHDFAVRLAEACDLDTRLITPASDIQLGWTATRPIRCALASNRGSPMPGLDHAIERFACHFDQSAMANAMN